MPDTAPHDHAPDAPAREGPAAGPTRFSPDVGPRVRRIAVGLAVLLLAGFAVVELVKARAASRLADETRLRASSAPLVDVVTVQGTPATGMLTLPGETAAWYQSIIYARVSGYVATWLVDIGDRVREGQVLATIETPELDAELAAARAKLKAAEADVRVREAETAFAKSTYERWKDSPKGVVSEQEREDKTAGFASAQAQLAAAEAQVNLVQADIDRLTAFEKFKQVTAPYDGTIVERRIDIGNLVTAGSTAGTSPLYRMVKDDPIRVFVDVPQSAAQELSKPGITAEVTASDLPGRVFRGKVVRSAEAVDPKSRTERVEIDLPNKDGSLVPGQYVEAAFHPPGTGIAEVPGAALVFRTSGPQVAVVGDDGTVKFHPVEIARDDGNQVNLLSGVAPGQKVVLNISSGIADGEKVQVSAEDGHMASAAGAPSP